MIQVIYLEENQITKPNHQFKRNNKTMPLFGLYTATSLILVHLHFINIYISNSHINIHVQVYFAGGKQYHPNYVSKC